MTIGRFMDLGRRVHNVNSDNNARIHAVEDWRSNSSTTSGGITKFDQDHVKHSYFLRGTANRFLSHHPPSEEFPAESEEVFGVDSFLQDRKGKEADGKASEPNDQEEDLANCLVMLSNGSTAMTGFPTNSSDVCIDKDATDLGKGLFQCKGCKKNFSSHQALGGHRASHKKVKGCFASGIDTNAEENDLTEAGNGSYNPVSEEETGEYQPGPFDHLADLFSPSGDRSKSKVHECSICHRVFSSGQALGGHKRCHWLNSTSGLPPEISPNSQPMSNFIFQAKVPWDYNYYSCNNESVSNSERREANARLIFPQKPEKENYFEFEPEKERFFEYGYGYGYGYEKQKQENERYFEYEYEYEKSDYTKNISVDNSPHHHDSAINHGKYYGIDDMKMKGVCASWLQIGMPSNGTIHHGSGTIG